MESRDMLASGMGSIPPLKRQLRVSFVACSLCCFHFHTGSHGSCRSPCSFHRAAVQAISAGHCGHTYEAMDTKVRGYTCTQTEYLESIPSKSKLTLSTFVLFDREHGVSPRDYRRGTAS